MKFAVSWLEEWVASALPPEQIAERMTLAGLEVDSIEVDGDALDGVIVGEVVEVGKHPNADRLSVCKVTVGSGELVDVVCGAPNVRAGLKTPFAPPGTRLPNGVKLRRSKIRGVVSDGMLCSAIEIGLGNESDGILELADDAPTGASLATYLGLPDAVIDVDITPNRGDCFSVLGVARDVSALTDTPLTGPAMAVVAPSNDVVHPVERPVPEACPRFSHRVVRGIDLSARSPLWMTERLRRSGLRSIHPVVDVTNYVMLELGQPLHAYDLQKLTGPIRPRYAASGESLTLLDDRQVELDENTVVISDDSGPIGLAGIMGGLSTMVTEDTVDVFFEAAFWPPSMMAGVARSYGMHTDASVRFERGVDPEGQPRAVERAVELLIAIAGGEAGPLVDDCDEEHLPGRDEITLTAARLRQVLGADIPADVVGRILKGLSLHGDYASDRWTVSPPAFRFDLGQEDDLIEEVARIYGYDRIPETTATANLPLSAVSEQEVAVEAVTDALISRGYQEVITYSFIDPALDAAIVGGSSELRLQNPISTEMAVMRSSLLPGLLSVASANVARQQDRVRIFEVGTTYEGALGAPVETLRVGGLILGPVVAEQWGTKRRLVDFFDAKADVETLIAMTGEHQVEFRTVTDSALQPGQAASIIRDGKPIGLLGKVHPTVVATFDLERDTFVFQLDVEKAFAASVPSARSISKFPAVRRDIAIVVADDVPSAALLTAVKSAAPALIQRVTVFDVYRGSGIEAGRKSIALGLILQETSRTLTDVDADAAVDSAVQKLQQEFNADLRE